jgi:hypothetical protein
LDAVVEAAASSLPELDLNGLYGEASPVLGAWDAGVLRVSLAKGFGAVFQDFSIRNDGALIAGPGSDLIAVRATGEVVLSFRMRQASHDASHVDLALPNGPEEGQTDMGHGFHFSGFSAVVVGVKAEASGIEFLEEHGAGVGVAIGSEGAEGHGVGLSHAVGEGIGEPASEEGDGVRGNVGVVQFAELVAHAEANEENGVSSYDELTEAQRSRRCHEPWLTF